MDNSPDVPSQEISLSFALHILDKRYHLEQWLETKTQSHILVNTLLGGMTVLTFNQIHSLDYTLRLILFFGLVCFMANLFLCIYLQIPKFRSRRQLSRSYEYDSFNPRSTAAIETFTVDDYKNRLSTITPHEMVVATADQIKQINSIIVQERRYLSMAAVLTIIGLVSVVYAMGSYSIGWLHILSPTLRP